MSGDLNGQVVKTLTEDTKNPDILYAGTETGLFVTLDRGKRWTRIKANLPDVRVDEITIQPRDNAMILATHGRAMWILDHLEPIQEYAAAEAAAGDATLFTPPPSAMYRRPARDRNYEFWGNQTFFGENPPEAAIITWLNKKKVGEVSLKIADAAGHEVREISGRVLSHSNTPGIQAACWDLRVQPLPALPSANAGQRPGAGARRPRRAGAGGVPAEGGAGRRARLRRRVRAAPVRRRRRIRRRRRPSPGRSSSAAPTRSRSSSTARPWTASRCASPRIRKSS